MAFLNKIEEDLTAALKAKDRALADVLRGLKTRLTNEKIAKGSDISEDDAMVFVMSELKKRKEAAKAYEGGGRRELAEKENSEAKILEKYLPAQLSEDEIARQAEQVILENGFGANDFGKAMGVMKAKVGASADGATIAKVLKERLK